MAFSGSDPVVFEVETLLLNTPQTTFTDVEDHGVRVFNTATTVYSSQTLMKESLA